MIRFRAITKESTFTVDSDNHKLFSSAVSG
jgi:hypothetical protein